MNEKEVEIYFENGRRAYCLNNPTAFAEMEERFGSKIIQQYKTGGKPGETKKKTFIGVPEIPGYAWHWYEQKSQYDNSKPTIIKYKDRNKPLPKKIKKVIRDEGIDYFKGAIGKDKWVDALLYKNKYGEIIGILNHYPFDFEPYEKKGNINVMVAPQEQGKGIGLKLIKEALKRYPDIDLYQQQWTPQGQSLLKQIGADKNYYKFFQEYQNEQKKVSKKDKGGEITPNKPTETEVAERWDKKKNQIATLTDNIQRLRYNTTRNINGSNQNNSSSSEKNYLTSLVVCLMDETGERVGNEESASNGHFGITGLKKKHIKIEGNKVTLKYVGKSGVEHEVTFTNEKIANALKRAISNSVSDFVFETSEGFKIKADKVNRYLTDYNVTAKDLRGYSANKWVVDKLKNIDIADNEKERKKQFNEIVKKVANDIGHGRATLKNHYLLPNLEPLFIERGKILSLNEN